MRAWSEARRLPNAETTPCSDNAAIGRPQADLPTFRSRSRAYGTKRQILTTRSGANRDRRWLGSVAATYAYGEDRGYASDGYQAAICRG